MALVQKVQQRNISLQCNYQMQKEFEKQERKKKEEEQKLIHGKSVIKIMGTIEIYDKNGRRSGTRNIYKELIVDVAQRTAFHRGNLDSWVSANYPGGKAKNISVTGQKPCTIEDYYRLRNSF